MQNIIKEDRKILMRLSSLFQGNFMTDNVKTGLGHRKVRPRGAFHVHVRPV